MRTQYRREIEYFKCIRDGKMFLDFDYARYATDMTPLQGCRLCGSVAEEKKLPGKV